MRKLCTVPMLYKNTMHQAGVYGAHGVWCANFLTAPVLSRVEHTSAFYGDKSTGRNTSAKTYARQPPLGTSAINGFLGYFYKGFLENIR